MDVKNQFLLGTCFFCLEKADHVWCDDCERDFIIEMPTCPICARISLNKRVCGSCLKNPVKFNKTEILFKYQYPANYLIKAFKFKNRPELAQSFIARFANKLITDKQNTPDILIPVPLHKKRQQQRGYNQSIELAKQLGNYLEIEVNTTLCSRIKNTDPQSTLPMKTRRTNVKDAFFLNNEPIPKHIAIIDDVITTGSTVNEIARILKRAGCQYVEVWAIARA